ncbi:alpha-L-rhamnosidase-related protein [Niabella drilacis]|uniref:Alpha-L-rhamnosidase n=1 Tax=Niabella drilacis (strain DSM 25811 / CCM 8410 / CCUG 62505 / LMG 26954 / E90) TaxID=1285928 RepID=A0A1G6IH34_NIADE|nr:family 78 glycoside hydrolase catalytic domain [Niabella drilacis]SDC05720.1 alpha-L-rhamnosidase [Niabella drilacis]
MKRRVLFLVLGLCGLCLLPGIATAQARPAERKLKSPLTREYVYPARIVWQQGQVKGAEQLLKEGIGQASLNNSDVVVLKTTGKAPASILLDFGREMNGALEIITGMWPAPNNPRKVRIRFGESVSEAMAELGAHGSTNDHAIRDFNLMVPWLGKVQSGESGFRFARIDLLDVNAEVHLKEVRVISTYRDIPYLGSFKCSNERLNKIWNVGAYTVHLNMQDYLWDGIKRDRLVWVGDLHPEVSTVNSVFGYNEVVPKSLDLARNTTPLPGWMSGISTYSMWWIIIQHEWYMHHGNLSYLKEQKEYLQGLLKQITGKVVNGVEKMDGNRFLDWPSSKDTVAIHAGLQAMTIWSLECGAKLSAILGDAATAKQCRETAAEMRKIVPPHNNSKQAAALLSLVGMMDAGKAYSDVLSVGGAKNFSTFYGYYMLEAMAKAGKYKEAMDIMMQYWGGMLDLGATTFWEDFNIDWMKNAARIDELVPAGKVDVHAAYGDYCYVGHRHSFCHGWASGPTVWLSEHVLGLKAVAPGGKVFRLKPHLGDLAFAEGTFPTKLGVIRVKHVKDKKGKVVTTVQAPKGIRILR